MDTPLDSRRRPALAVLDDVREASLLLDPERRRLVQALREKPDSATGLARRLGDTRQRLNYHLRTLEDAGVLEVMEERRKGNCTERVLGVVARRFVVDPTALGGLDVGPEEVGDRFSATYLVALASRTIRELASLMRRAGREERRLATASLSTDVRLATPDDFRSFVDDLAEAVSAVIARYHDEGGSGRTFRILLGSYPGPGGARSDDIRPEEEA